MRGSYIKQLEKYKFGSENQNSKANKQIIDSSCFFCISGLNIQDYCQQHHLKIEPTIISQC